MAGYSGEGYAGSGEDKVCYLFAYVCAGSETFLCLLVVNIQLFFQSKILADFFELSLEDLVYVLDTCGKNVT